MRRVERLTTRAIHTDEGRDSDGEESSQGRYEKGGEEKISPLFFARRRGASQGALFLSALGSLLRHCFLLRISDSASDGPHGRHNGWAEPSTLIPDVDYG